LTATIRLDPDIDNALLLKRLRLPAPVGPIAPGAPVAGAPAAARRG
jgi:hypothetical protein